MLFSVALLAARIRLTGHQSLRFLLWNLFLAMLPFGASWVLREAHERVPRLARSGLFAPLWVLWLVFWPNAPYLLTDLIHLAPRSDVPLWVDLLLLLSCAHNGLLLGFGSLVDIERTIELRFERHQWPRLVVVGSVISLGAFAMFLGRFHRWNSWDLWFRPREVLNDMLAIALHPFAHRAAWCFTIAVSGFLAVGYGQFRSRAIAAS